jgi:hypothetical protein
MRLLKVMTISLLLVACESSAKQVDGLRYYKDHKTNLCFVENNTYYGYEVFSNVPCTPEVEALIAQSEKANH